MTLLTFQLDNFPVESLFELVEDFLAKIKSADISAEESIELFPKVLSCLAAKPNLTTEQGKRSSRERCATQRQFKAELSLVPRSSSGPCPIPT